MGFAVTLEGLDELERDLADGDRALSDGVRASVAAAVEEGAAAARAEHRYKDQSGDLTRSIRGIVEISTPGGAIGVIAATVPYASYVEEGTEAHDIRPKEGHGFVGPLKTGQSRRDKTDIGTHRVALRWISGGVTHFASMVHHPGTTPFPFMSVAYLKAERVIERDVEKSVARVQQIVNR